jgi:hypothetical protein
VKNVALEDEVHELPVAHGLHEPRGLELLDVVRERGSRDTVSAMQRAARHRLSLRPDLLQHPDATRLGERTCDARELGVGEAGLGARGHIERIARGGEER